MISNNLLGEMIMIGLIGIMLMLAGSLLGMNNPYGPVTEAIEHGWVSPRTLVFLLAFCMISLGASMTFYDSLKNEQH